MRAVFFAAALAFAALIGTGHQAVGQTVRFETSVGDFDMVLNPTDNPNLQPLVDNIVAYIGLGRYHNTVINRAVDSDNTNPADDFVLQMGSFLGFPRTPELWATDPQAIERFNSGVVVDSNGDGQVDFSTAGLTNSRGTISLALAGGDPNSGTTSFFVNLGNNSFLDSQGFVPFAEIEDLTTIDTIMALTQNDLSDEAGQPGSLTFVDVPVTERGRLVVIERVRVVEAEDDFSFIGPIATALEIENRDLVTSTSSATSAASSAATMSASGGSGASAAVSTTSTPEPASGVLLLGAAAGAALRRRR